MTKTQPQKKTFYFYYYKQTTTTKKNHQSIFPEENVLLTNPNLYFLQNHVDLRIGMGGEKKREEGVVKKLHYSYFRQLEQEVQIETTFH